MIINALFLLAITTIFSCDSSKIEHNKTGNISSSEDDLIELSEALQTEIKKIATLTDVPDQDEPKAITFTDDSLKLLDKLKSVKNAGKALLAKHGNKSAFDNIMYFAMHLESVLSQLAC